MSNLVDRALWAWAWYVRFYKGVIYFVLAWWLWPILLIVLFLPFILLKVWWTGSVYEPAVVAGQLDARIAAIHEAQALVAQVDAEAHDLVQRIHALRPHAEQALRGEQADSISEWKTFRDFDPDPIIAAGLERLVALGAAQRRHEVNRTDPLAQTQIDRELERTRSWAAANTAQLQEISSSLKLIEQSIFDRQALSDTP